jgi:hypothetical protein
MASDIAERAFRHVAGRISMSRLASGFSITGIAAAVAFALGGCASSPPPLAPQQIESAQGGDLRSLYDENTARIAGKNLQSKKGREALAQHNRLGVMVAERYAQAMREDGQKQLTPDGFVPLPVIEEQITKLPEVIRWDPAALARLTEEFGRVRERTRSAIAAQQEQLAQLDQNAAVQRVAVLQTLGGLTRDPRYDSERGDIIATLRKKLAEAIAAEQYGDAKLALMDLAEITPDDQSLQQQRVLVETRLFEQEFWSQLGDGLPDDAYAQLITASEGEEFPAMLELLGGSTGDMVAYYMAQAGTAFSENRLGDTYRLLNQVRDLRARVNVEATPAPQEEAFLKTIYERYEVASKADNIGLALGYLKIIERFNPEYPGLTDALQTTQQMALARATRKVDMTPFTDATGNSEFGGTVAASLTEQLATRVPKGIELLEHKAPAAKASAKSEKGEKRSAKASKKKKGGKTEAPADIVTADYLIKGQILESRVDSRDDSTRKVMRVTTGSRTVDNPAHAEWAGLSETQRASLPEPESTVTENLTEDVTVNVQSLRKVGVITAAYRLIEAKTGKVLASGSETVREEFADEGNEGVEIGDFHLPVKQAHLPDDEEILQKLAAKISGVIGDRLAQELESPESRYAEAARRFIEEGDLAKAAENAAYSFTLATLNGQETSAQMLEEYALKADLQTTPVTDAASTTAATTSSEPKTIVQ